MSPEPNNLTVSVHAPVPSDETAAQALLGHLTAMALGQNKAGWRVHVTLQLTRPGDEG